MNNIIRPECATVEWKKKETGVKLKIVEAGREGCSVHFPMNFKERYIPFVDISLTIFHFNMILFVAKLVLSFSMGCDATSRLSV